MMDKNKQIAKRRISVRKTSPKSNSKTQNGSGLFDKKKIAKAKEETETKLSRSFNYDLRFYQTFPAFYLKNIAPEQKGLLVNHLMGTGKTFTGINFLTDYPDKKALIVCPEHLKSNWINELNKLGVNNLSISFLNYDMFIDLIIKIDKNSLSNYILILDEGHHLVYKIRYNLNENQISDIYDKTKYFYKIMFLSGTPFYNDEYDIIYIMNLVSGENLLPFNIEEFSKEYIETSIIKSGFYGWIYPIISSKAVLYSLIISILAIYGNVIYSMFSIKEFKFNIVSSYLPKIDGEFDTTKALINAELIENEENKPVYKLIKKFTDFLGLNERSQTFKDEISKEGLIISFILLISSLLILSMIVLAIGNYDLNKIRDINTSKLGKKIQNYVSFYEIKEIKGILEKLRIKNCHSYDNVDSYFINSFCNSYLSNLNDDKFPKKELIIKKVEFTEPQMELFIKATYNKLNTVEIDLIGIKFKEKDVYSKLNEKDYLNYARAIGNLTLKDEKDNIIIPNKFLEILKISENKQSVIYSNFYEKGILLFANFLENNNLTYKNLKYKILMNNHSISEYNSIINEFKEGKIQYLLLHPDLKEGISILGTEQLHILEPLDNYAKFDQVCARVIRYNSHTHLPVKDRKVKIYQWITKTRSFAKGLVDKFKGWKKYSPQVIIWKRLAEFDDNLSADSILHDKTIRTSKLFEEFNDAIKEYSIESCSVKNKNFNCDLPYSIREMFKE